jgi:hypothetical protein
MTGGGLTLPFVQSSNGAYLSITNSTPINTPNPAIYGETQNNNDSPAVFGKSNTGSGIKGESTNQYGVYGTSINNIAGRFLNSSITTATIHASNSMRGMGGPSAYFNGAVDMVGNVNVNGNLDVTKALRINLTELPLDVAIHIKGRENGTWNQGIRLESPISNDTGGILYDNDGLKFRVFDSNDQYYFRNSANTNLARINATGDLNIAGTLTQNSDSRLKRNIQPVSFSLANLQKIKGYNYYWKEAKTNDDLQTGLIAQEVQAIFPELVATDEAGMLSVNYTGLIPHLVEAVKDLKNENDDLKKRLDKIEKLLK